jgi:hypothetical protein
MSVCWTSYRWNYFRGLNCFRYDFCYIVLENLYIIASDLRCDIVVRVPGYRSRGPGFDSGRYQIFWEVVSLERGPLSFVSTIEELLGRKSRGSGLENREYWRGDPLRWPHNSLCSQKLALTSPTSGDYSVGIVPSRTKATEFSCYVFSPVVTKRLHRIEPWIGMC